MLDWIFEGIVTWVSSIASELMDAVSRVFLAAQGLLEDQSIPDEERR